jgi:hypothetical protein
MEQESKPMTNYERIKAMSVEEMAEKFRTTDSCPDPYIDCREYDSCSCCWIEWLESERDT